MMVAGMTGAGSFHQQGCNARSQGAGRGASPEGEWYIDVVRRGRFHGRNFGK